MKDLTYAQKLWVDNLINRENMTKDEASNFVVCVCDKIKSQWKHSSVFISYEDIQDEIYKLYK
jgi:hypothetical protein